MDRETTILAAWDDFFLWVKLQPAWANISRQQKQYIYRTNLDRKNGVDVEKRVRTILGKYGGDRYEFKGTVIIHE